MSSLRNIWNDAVWSKVIAHGIINLIQFIGGIVLFWIIGSYFFANWWSPNRDVPQKTSSTSEPNDIRSEKPWPEVPKEVLLIFEQYLVLLNSVLDLIEKGQIKPQNIAEKTPEVLYNPSETEQNINRSQSEIFVYSSLKDLKEGFEKFRSNDSTVEELRNKIQEARKELSDILNTAEYIRDYAIRKTSVESENTPILQDLQKEFEGLQQKIKTLEDSSRAQATLNDSVQSPSTVQTKDDLPGKPLPLRGIVPVLEATATSLPPGGQTAVSVTNGPGNQRDFVGLYPASAPTENGSYENLYDWKYLSNTKIPPPTGLSSVMLTFTMPTFSGTYHFRFFRSNSPTLLATSNRVTVGSTNRP